MKHILLIDPLEKLNQKKDSTLLLAISLKNLGAEVYLLLESDFYISTNDPLQFWGYDFSGKLDDLFYIQTLKVEQRKQLIFSPGDVIHMRLDPPFDGRYLRYLWMLSFLENKGLKVLNSPKGILLFNEKILAIQSSYSVESFIGNNVQECIEFIRQQEQKGIQQFILKPLDMYQGLGVEKISSNVERLSILLENKIKECQGPIILQPFLQEVYQGEVRSIYYNAQELGSILKIPPQGSFLANIAQGAKYQKYILSPVQAQRCQQITQELLQWGVNWVAFDIIGDFVSEVNITCPGLLVEVSSAWAKNLALEICREFES